MNQITVRELYELCQKEIMKGNGHKNIVVADDEEGNGYHGLFIGFSEDWEDCQEDLFYDTDTTSKINTIILG